LDIYQTEDEQVEALKKWWRENGKSALFGVALGLLAIFGWRGWKDYKFERAVAASQLYQEMAIAARDNKTEIESRKAKEIANTYKSTAYAVFAKLDLAKLAVADGKLDSAAADLQWALDNSSEDSLHHIITLRLARVFISLNQLDKAKAMLDVKTPRGEFEVGYQELEGDILRRQGKISAARDAYQNALNTAHDSGQDTTILDMKLDDLGRAKI